MIESFYDPEEGEIFFDEVYSEEKLILALRATIGYEF
jgi:ABC-type proline/glycine betaine transport system ATPase subunit